MKFDFDNELKRLRDFIGQRENRINFLILLIITMFIIGVLLYKGMGIGNKYIVDKDGNIIGITRNSSNEFVSYPLEVEVKKNEKKLDEIVTINLKGKEETSRESKKIESENELSNSIKKIVDDIGRSKDKSVILPKSMPGGISLSWNRVKNYNSLFLMIVPFIIMSVVYFDKRKKELDSELLKNEMILKALPGFNDQLIMLLNCGLIFNDAFYTLIRSYSSKKDKDYFTNMILEIGEVTKTSSKSLINIMQDKGISLGNRWFSRMVSVIVENQRKGVDLCEKLSRDGELIWEERKKRAIEKGKLAESKMSFPLAILLIVLIIVTALPAMLQVKGG